jgi:2-polyprenyl-3-methyl-5-hydroxy-6-metoxy-1,4-benzoquinol methylase
VQEAYYSHFSARRATRAGDALNARFRADARRLILAGPEAGPEAGAQRILDVGPGRGQWMDELSALGHQVIGLDLSRDLCKLLSKQGRPVAQASGTALPFLQDQFDVIIAMHLVEHLETYSDVLEFFCQCRMTLRPGGRLAIACPNYLAWREYFYDVDNSHHYPATSYRLNQVAKDAGLTTTRVQIYAGPFRSWPVRVVCRAILWAWPRRLFAERSWRGGIWEKLHKMAPAISESILLVIERPT